MYHYSAFISYNHNPRDIKIASTLQSQLENYRIPKEIKMSSGIDKVGRIFLDKGELGVEGDLNEVIRNALEDTDHLIVICSPESKQSIWVQREIEFFLRNHSVNDILTVITEGEPFDVLPEILFHKDRHDADGETDGEQETLREPLSCDYRLPPRTARNAELPRLVAALIGCKYDDLVQRQRHYRMRRITIAMTAAAVVLLSAVTYLIWSNNQIKANLEASQREQSMTLSLQSEQALRSGDMISALRYAVDALPSDEKDRPVVPEAVLALSRAMNLYKVQETNLMDAVRRYPSYGNRHIRLAACKKTGSTYVSELYSNGKCVIWNADNGTELMPDYTAGLLSEGSHVQNLTFTGDGELLLITGDSIRIVDPGKETEIRSIPIEGEYLKLYDYRMYKTECDTLTVRNNKLWIPVAIIEDKEDYSDYKVRLNSRGMEESLSIFARDADETADLVLNRRRQIKSDIKYKILRIDLNTGKVSAEADAPGRPSKIRISPDEKLIACGYSSYYEADPRITDPGEDKVVIMDAGDLSTVNSIGGTFISDFGFVNRDRFIMCGFDEMPEAADTSLYGVLVASGNGPRSVNSFTSDRNLVISCYDSETFTEQWNRKDKIHAGGVPWLTVSDDDGMFSNAVLCITGNTMLITDPEGKELGRLNPLSAVTLAFCIDNSLFAFLDDGEVTTWTYDKDHGFKAYTDYNVLKGPVILLDVVDGELFAVSNDTDSGSANEVLTQYKPGGIDTRWEAYPQDEDASDNSSGMKRIDTCYCGDTLVEVFSEPDDRSGNFSERTAEIVVRESDSGKIIHKYEIAISYMREGSSTEEPEYASYFYSGIDSKKGKVYFLDNRNFRELTLMSVDLKNGKEEKIPLTCIKSDGNKALKQGNWLCDTMRPSDLYSGYEDYASAFSIDEEHIFHTAYELKSDPFKSGDSIEVYISTVAVDPDAGEAVFHNIGGPAEEVDTTMYGNARINAACKRGVMLRDSHFEYFGFDGKEIWTGDELSYEPAGFTVADDGTVIALEKNGINGALHIYSSANGAETAVTDLGSVNILSHEKMSCTVLSDDEKLVTAGDDAYLLDSSTWNLRTVIGDSFIAFDETGKQFMLQRSISGITGHVPYRTLKEMIAEAKESLTE